MPYVVTIKDAEQQYPQYTFIEALTPSEQKAAFHVKDESGTDLCLKLISPSYDVDRVNREIETLQKMSHPNVVRIIEYLYSSRVGERRHHIVEEYVEGVDLTDLLDGKPWPLGQIIGFFTALLAGVAALGEDDVVHRDLKPANIRVRHDGSPVIIDFGLVRRLSLPDLTDTAQGARIGTPAYFAPEQFRGEKRDIDHRTDLFAAGVLMYEACTGMHPFYRPGMSVREIEEAVCDGDDHLHTSEFAALPHPLEVLLRKLLNRSRARRPASAKQIAQVLKRAKVEKNA